MDCLGISGSLRVRLAYSVLRLVIWHLQIGFIRNFEDLLSGLRVLFAEHEGFTLQKTSLLVRFKSSKPASSSGNMPRRPPGTFYISCDRSKSGKLTVPICSWSKFEIFVVEEY